MAWEFTTCNIFFPYVTVFWVESRYTPTSQGSVCPTVHKHGSISLVGFNSIKWSSNLPKWFRSDHGKQNKFRSESKHFQTSFGQRLWHLFWRWLCGLWASLAASFPITVFSWPKNGPVPMKQPRGFFPQTVYCWGSQCCLKCVRLGWDAVSASLVLSSSCLRSCLPTCLRSGMPCPPP